MLIKEIKALNNGHTVYVHGMGDSTQWESQFFHPLKLMYKLNITPINIPVRFFYTYQKIILKFIWKGQQNNIGKE